MKVTLAILQERINTLNFLQGNPLKPYSNKPGNGYYQITHGTLGQYVSNGTVHLEKRPGFYTLQAMSKDDGNTGVTSLKSGNKKEILEYLQQQIYKAYDDRYLAVKTQETHYKIEWLNKYGKVMSYTAPHLDIKFTNSLVKENIIYTVTRVETVTTILK